MLALEFPLNQHPQVRELGLKLVGSQTMGSPSARMNIRDML